MIIALLFLILFAILFPKALRFLIIISILALGIAASHARETTDELVASYQPAKARCIKYGGGTPLNYDAGERGERDCENLGYIIKTLMEAGCHYKKAKWICIK